MLEPALRAQSTYNIHGVGSSSTWKLAMCDIQTIGELADHADLPRLSRESSISRRRLQKLQLRARSIVNGETIQTAPFQPPGNPIYYDIETDLRCERVWLIALLTHGELTQLYADDWSRERDILTQFMATIQALPDHTLVSYSGTRFDSRVLMKAMNRNNVPHEPFKATPEIDLCTQLRRSYIFPTRGYALKELASHLGYPFRNPSLDGRAVAEHYHRHVEEGVKLDPRVLEYNGDDVQALQYICDHLRGDRESSTERHSPFDQMVEPSLSRVPENA
jgi:predicted RecB family nuclease